MKTAVVTGGTRGIGKAISLMLLNNGYKVYSLYRSDTTTAKKFSAETANELLTVLKCDISDPRQIKDFFTSLDGCEVLVNNAGISDIDLYTDLSDERIMEILKVDLLGAMLCSKSAIPFMVRKKTGSIINISSMWGETGASCEAVYSACKAGVIGFTKALAKELGPSSIRVNCVSPGLIATDMNSSLSNETVDGIVSETPLERVGSPTDVANAVEFLVSDKASFITGEVIRVNGGLLI